MTFSIKLTPRIVLTPHVRNEGGRRRTTHIWYTSDATATAKNRGCSRCNQNRHPALNNETRPSPARTCGSTHQLGVSKAAKIDNTPARFGSVPMGNNLHRGLYHGWVRARN